MINKELINDQPSEKAISPEVLDQRLLDYLQPSPKTEQQISLNLINTRLWLNELSQQYQRPITLDTIPDEAWADKLTNYDIFWFMGIYSPSQFSANHAKKYTNQYTYALPDIDAEKDVVASPFAVANYLPNPQLVKDWPTWDRMVEKLHQRDKKVFIDFVPNHTAVDHPWANEHPEYFIQGSEGQYRAHPNFYQAINNDHGQVHYLAHGKDPNYPEWADTLQLNYGRPEVHQAMTEQLLSLVDHVDGLRCDMAMLLNPSTFLRTWAWALSNEERDYVAKHSFWHEAIPQAKAKAMALGKSFDFMAEAYWEKNLLAENFDYIYRDELYKHLLRVARGENCHNLKEHIAYLLYCANDQQTCKDTVYLENHDEERAVRTMGREFSQAAAALISFLPHTMLLINQGQEEGSTIKPPMQVGRFPQENKDLQLKNYYQNLLQLKQSKLFREGQWSMAQLAHQEDNLITLEVVSQDRAIKALICINMGRNSSHFRIPQQASYQTLSCYDLNNDRYSHLDAQNGNLELHLPAFNTQIVFFAS
ncbi:MAG TPA: alpha-amylase family glycosyl hydrolase [Candidatus Woesebacteria bacterium]|nr:alpha-amylase family glycosyl hydrolase [Candidatus Woesebacteria bacterium]